MLTDKQQKAVSNFDDNILLLARAGAGKTFTLSNKIAEALKRGINPEEILCVTFTVKAAEEIKESILGITGESGVAVNTIHGFCYNVIKEYAKTSGEFREPDIADEVDAGEILQGVLIKAAEDEEYKLTDGAPMLPPAQLGKIVSHIKHRRDELGYDWFSSGGYTQSANSLFAEGGDFVRSFSIRKFGVKITDYDLMQLLRKNADKFIGEYDRILRSSDLMDFDDLIFATKCLLKRTDIFKLRYKLIIIDEMQDTSRAEYAVMREFFDGALVMMCGDEFQTIYGWRGSEPRIIMDDYRKNFGAVTVTLSGNRRSSPVITYACSYYLHSTFGLEKPDNRPIDGYNRIDIVKCRDIDAEAEEIFDRLLKFGGEPSDICVMARSNRYIADICSRLDKLNAALPEEDRLNFFTADKDFQFYKKPVIKDFLAFFRLLVNPEDVPSFERIGEKYISGVGRGLLGAIRDMGKEGVCGSCFLSADTYAYGDNYYSLYKAYREGKIVVYDLETTGLDLTSDDFIQISAIKFGSDGDVWEMNIFVIPVAPMSAEAEKTHGYGIEKLKEFGAVSAKEALVRFAEFTDGCVLVGHNSFAFDDVILDRTAAREGVRINAAGRYDTLSISRLFRPDLRNHKLSELCNEFKIVNVRAHDAFADVTATRSVLEIMIRKYILPTATGRSGFLTRHRDKFRDFYGKYNEMRKFLSDGDILALVKYVGDDCGVLKANPRKADRDSANDLYRAIKGAIGGSNGGFEEMRDFLAAAALSGSQMDIMVKKLRKIPLITVHQSKGCEFDCVILAGAGENEFPSYGARMSGNEEEEKRVFYVALSRAKESLAITYCAGKRYGDKYFERLPSPYLSALPEDCLERKERS